MPEVTLELTGISWFFAQDHEELRRVMDEGELPLARLRKHEQERAAIWSPTHLVARCELLRWYRKE